MVDEAPGSRAAPAQAVPALAVTTSGKSSPALIRESQEAARRWSLPWIERRASTIGALLSTRAQALLIFERERIALVDLEGSLTFHAGMAHLRVQRLASGEGDALVRVAALSPGDHVLDCTLGLGQDARVAAAAVGPGGSVVGLEQSLALFAVQDAGFRREGAPVGACTVRPLHAEAGAYLRAQPSRSVDVVFFDPMFEKPKKAQPAFALLRRFAHPAPLTRAVVDEALRVARKRVVIKAGKYSSTLRELGLEDVERSRYSDVVWSAIPVDGAAHP